MVTIIMEQRFRHMTILSVYPHEAFVGANEISLKSSSDIRESLAVMVVQNERGKDHMMVAFSTVRGQLVAGYGTALESDDAATFYNTFLATGCTFNAGAVAIRGGKPGETSSSMGGFLVSLGCVGALTFRFVLGPGMYDRKISFNGEMWITGPCTMPLQAYHGYLLITSEDTVLQVRGS